MRGKLVLGLLAALTLLALASTAPPVAAQESANSTANTTVVAQVDDRIRVTSFTYDHAESEFRIGLENFGDEVSRVTITEAISRQAATAGQFGIETITVDPGDKLTVTMTARTRQPVGVMITTRESVDAGHGTFLPAHAGGGQVLKGEPTGGHVRAAGTGGVTGALFGAFLGAWYYLANRYRGSFKAPIGVGDSTLVRYLLRKTGGKQ